MGYWLSGVGVRQCGRRAWDVMEVVGITCATQPWYMAVCASCDPNASPPFPSPCRSPAIAVQSPTPPPCRSVSNRHVWAKLLTHMTVWSQLRVVPLYPPHRAPGPIRCPELQPSTLHERPQVWANTQVCSSRCGQGFTARGCKCGRGLSGGRGSLVTPPDGALHACMHAATFPAHPPCSPGPRSNEPTQAATLHVTTQLIGVPPDGKPLRVVTVLARPGRSPVPRPTCRPELLPLAAMDPPPAPPPPLLPDAAANAWCTCTPADTKATHRMHTCTHVARHGLRSVWPR